MKSQHSGVGAMAAALLACVFGVTMFLSMAAGAFVYRNVTDRTETSSAERVGLSYISTRVHSYDESGMVEVGSFGGGDAIFLYEDFDGIRYETILYVYDGWLRELLCEQGFEPEAAGGEKITEAAHLSVSKPVEGLLHLEYTASAESGSRDADIHLRSEI